jgi:hypothetical protein
MLDSAFHKWRKYKINVYIVKDYVTVGEDVRRKNKNLLKVRD